MLTGVILTGVILTGVILTGVILTGVILTGMIWAPCSVSNTTTYACLSEMCNVDSVLSLKVQCRQRLCLLLRSCVACGRNNEVVCFSRPRVGQCRT